MEVQRRKGLANHPNPESCGKFREGSVEALTGETAGQPLSREIKIWEADVVKRSGRQHGAKRCRKQCLDPTRS